MLNLRLVTSSILFLSALSLHAEAKLVSDPTFNEAEPVNIPYPLNPFSVQFHQAWEAPDGGIITIVSIEMGALNSLLRIAKYTAEGKLDTSYGDQGAVEETSKGSYSQSYLFPDGRVLILKYDFEKPRDINDGGHFKIGYVSADGVFDSKFGWKKLEWGDLRVVEWMAYAETHLRRIGDQFLIATSTHPQGESPRDDQATFLKFNLDGTLDRSFGKDGIIRNDYDSEDHYEPVFDVIVLRDNTFLSSLNFKNGASGYEKRDFNGQVVRNFGEDGILTSIKGGELKVTSDDKFVVISDYKVPNGDPNLEVWGIEVSRYNSNGSLDLSFGFDGQVQFYPDAPEEMSHNTEPLKTAIGHDGRIYVLYRVVYDDAIQRQGWGVASITPAGKFESTKLLSQVQEKAVIMVNTSLAVDAKDRVVVGTPHFPKDVSRPETLLHRLIHK